jgi:tetratricopeptide (TPR) repeat protein
MSQALRLCTTIVLFALVGVSAGHAVAQEFLVSRAASPVKSPPSLAVGATAGTAKGERRRLALGAGAVLLNQNTRIRRPAADTLVVEAGEVIVDAPKGSTLKVRLGTESFAIDNARIAVRVDKSPSVLVLRGSATESATRSVVVKAGEFRENGRTTTANRSSRDLQWTASLEEDGLLVPASRSIGGDLVAKDPQGNDAKIILRRQHVDVHIEDGFARTTIDQTYFSAENFALEGTFLFPLPADASLSRLAMYVDGVLREGSMVERDRARNIYESIRYANRDPALLEWVDGTTFKMRVFPLEPRTERRILLSYVQRLPVAYGQMSYRFPAGSRPDKLDRWSFSARVVGGAEMTWRSPSHDLTATKADGDVLLEGAATKIRADRDIVLELVEPTDVPATRVSTFEQDGSRYLMVRHRPTIDGAHPAGKRHWAFLFESSGDRDPLLGRTQIEVIRHLLAQLDADDTFQVFAAGTRTRAFVGPRNPTPESIQAAIGFLETSHLVGALDLGKALESIPNAGGEAYLVHVGSGFAALGVRDHNELVKRIAPRMTYVGIGVGKRWDRAFLKTAAERTGGYFTQVNPDESIPWRAFEIASALKNPRWLDATVEALDGATEGYSTGAEPTTETPKFLTMTGTVLRGEELVAITRVGPAAESKHRPGVFALPTQLRISRANGVSRSQEVLSIKGARPDAAYLPRMWAKLELDRLVAADAVKNRERVVDLSKSMFVMSPFTSLLVLENDDMQTQYKVAGGRKDHWAMYRAPDRIEVVVEPEPGQPDPRKAGQRPTAKEVAKSVLMRVRLNRPVVMKATNQLTGFDANEDSMLMSLGFSHIVDDSSSPEPAKVGHIYIVGEKVDQDRVMRRSLADADLPTQATYLRMPSPTFPTPAPAILDVPMAERDFHYPDSAFKSAEANAARAGLFESWGSLPPLEMARAMRRGEVSLASSPFLEEKHTKFARRVSQIEADSFYDLIALAPGMNSSQADALAAIEAEAQPTPMSRIGKIDAGVRELLDRARAAGWRRWTLGDESRVFDGSGRFVEDRTLPSGIRERVECDGTTLVHLYPQLHVGARRDGNRFLRLAWSNRNPWVVPDAEDLARGADLRRIDDHTVALVPHGSDRPGTDAIHVHYFFDKGRLAEIRYVSAAKKTSLARVVLEPTGVVRLLGEDGKELHALRGKLEPATAPTFTSDLKDLVVLPLPYRPVEHVNKQLGLEKKSIDQLTLAEALPVFAAHFGAGNGGMALNVFNTCFVRREQKPLGMYVLLAALGQNLDSQNLDVIGEHPDQPLAQYLALHTSPVLRQHASQWAVQSGSWDGFLGRMSLAHALLQRWGDKRIEKLSAASLKMERAKALDFVQKNKDRDFGWDLLCRMQDRTDVKDLAGQRELATAFGWFAESPGVSYAARYEVARCLWRSGDAKAAQAKFVDVYDRAAAAGALPPVDADFRSALESAGLWTKAISRAADRLLAGTRRDAVLALAWQVWQLEDRILANDLEGRALDGITDDAERTKMRVAALEYLWKTNQAIEGSELVDRILSEPESRKRAEFWRLGVKFADHRGLSARALECRENALAIEFRNLPEVLNLTQVDSEYGTLLSTYRQLAESMRTLEIPPPAGFATKIVRAADRWRSLNPAAEKASTETAAILRIVGDRDLAWDYETTPLGRNPHGSEAWWNLAKSLAAAGDADLADSAFAAAFEAEPTNPQILWEQADNLRRLGRGPAADGLVRRIADGSWQPRFQGLANEAKARTGP